MQLYLTEFPQEAFKAVPLLRQSLLTCEVMLGAENVDTAESRKALGHGLLDCVRLSSMCATLLPACRASQSLLCRLLTACLSSS